MDSRVSVLVVIIQICISITTATSQSDGISEKINFSRDHVTVLFDPWSSADSGNASQETELISKIKLISTRFSKILVDSPADGTGNISSVANATAKFNQNRTHPNTPLAHLWVRVPYQLGRFPFVKSGTNDPLNYLRNVRNAVEDANSIYPGSVEGIILHSDYFIHSSNNSIIASNLPKIHKIFHNETIFQYKLAVYFPNNRTFLNVTRYKAVAPILAAIDACCVMTSVPPSAEFVKKGVNATIQRYQAIFTTMAATITGLNSTRNLIPIFETGYPDTSNDSQVVNRFEDLVKFWKDMGNWAVRSNVTVVFTEAFDVPERPFPALKTQGWWTQMEDDTEDGPIFKEKAAILKESPSPVEIHDKAYFLDDKNFYFRENSHMAVQFNPDPTINLTTSLDKISERFTQISVRDEDMSLSDLANFSAVLRSWNEKRISSGKSTIKISSLTFSPQPPMEGRVDVNTTNSAIAAIQAINTVQGNSSVTVQMSFFKNFKYSTYLGELLHAKNKFTENNLTCKFGVEFPLSACKNGTVIKPVLGFVDFVTLRHLSSDPGIHQTIKKCRKNIEKGTGVQAKFSVGWKGTGTKDFARLVRFWGEVGTWADREKVGVEMTQAFDNLEDKWGWWAVVNTSGEVDFIEKRTLLMEDVTGTEAPTTEGGDVTSTERGGDVTSTDRGGDVTSTDGGGDESTSPVTTPSTSTTTEATTSEGNVNVSQVINAEAGLGSGPDDATDDHEWWFWINCGVPTGCALVVSSILALLIVWKLKRNKRELTQEEEREFFEGTRSGDSLGEEVYINSKYNADQHEIPLQNIAFDSAIGSGKFAFFYKGVVQNIIVAVKAPKKSCTKQYFKSMLMDVKIMASIGEHPNVLKFFGATTKDVKKGTVYIINEYCETGTLHSFLRTLRYNLDAVEDNPSKKLENVSDLYRFSQEIAAGMHYLSEKDVIHGTLTAANVLLDGRNTCKIFNYGLTRKLDENGEYLQRKEESFPWRWIAMETLKHKIVTGRSDVWSYGVVLWEIFSLGRIPYKSNEQEGFLEKLEKGLRLKRPQYATQDVYENMMQCWSKNPADRPQFKEQAEYFLVLMKEECDQFDTKAK